MRKTNIKRLLIEDGQAYEDVLDEEDILSDNDKWYSPQALWDVDDDTDY